MVASLSLSTPVERLYSVGPATARRLEKLEILTVGDLLLHLPARFDDFSRIVPISEAREGEIITVEGKIDSIKNEFTRGGFVLQKLILTDPTGSISALWFNQRFLTKSLHRGDQVLLSGKVKANGLKLQLDSPQYELKGAVQLHTGRLVPIYPETAGVTSKWLRGRIYWLLSQISAQTISIPELLEEDIRSREGLLPKTAALWQAHFPNNLADFGTAKKTLAFLELLEHQVIAHDLSTKRIREKVARRFDTLTPQPQLAQFIEGLPFTLTGGQKQAWEEILADLGKPSPMNRLLQGDVGSGKTVVAALALYLAFLNHSRALVMAPTEVLATQHLQTLTALLTPLGVKIGIATGSTKNYSGADVVVGTQALLTKKFQLPDLGLIVIDEQHRFGVEQRGLLAQKGQSPHLLTMTATPIPRTIALTLYGDLDISYIGELPKSRRPVKTWLVPETKRLAAYDWIRRQPGQIFIVCPLIEESETNSSVRAVQTEYQRLTREVFPELSLALLHGKLAQKTKDSVLREFKNKKFKILVTTPVVEVGIDIPEATVMVIEGAERFGLAQLHQLRGRVGRGEEQSFCLLFTDRIPPQAVDRLRSLETVQDGLTLSEIDLRFRGPGQRYGLAQHGAWGLKIADFSDLELIKRVNQLETDFSKRPLDFPLLLNWLNDSKIRATNN